MSHKCPIQFTAVKPSTIIILIIIITIPITSTIMATILSLIMAEPLLEFIRFIWIMQS